MQKGTLRLVLAAALLCLAGGAVRQARGEEIVAITARGPGVPAVPSIFSFDSAAPNAISTPVPLPFTGETLANELLGIDFRPATGELYGLTGVPERLFTLNPATGQATLAATAGFIGSQNVGLDFNPVTDELRVFSNRGEGPPRLNLRLNPDTGSIIQDPLLSYAAGDPNFGRNPNLLGLAYSDNVAGASATTLYGIDASTRALVTVDGQSGVLRTVATLGGEFTPLLGRYLSFDISGVTGMAYAAVVPATNPVPQLYTINLGTGAASLVGRIGDGTTPLPVIGIAVAPAPIPEPTTLALLGTGLLGAGAAAVRQRRKGGKPAQA
jgi:hypothetical protein